MSKQFMAEQDMTILNYLKRYITVETYFDIVGQIVTMLQKMQREGMQVALDMQTMQVENGKVKFQLTMEDSVYDLEKIQNFLKEMTFGCIFEANENCQKVTSFLQYLDNPSACISLEAIMQYCFGEAGQTNTQPQMRQQSIPPVQTVQAQMRPQSVPSGQLNRQQSQSVQSQPNIQQRQGVLPQQSMQSQAAVGETGVLGAGFWENLEQQYQQGDTQNGETGVLDPSFWEKALQNTPSVRLDNPRQSQIVYGKLVNVKTGQETLITRDNFWIGKEDVDLQISKEVISRRHAVLISKDNHYFVSDNGSTNKTYVNNREIPARASVEIFNGTRIKFANEEYEFQI